MSNAAWFHIKAILKSAGCIFSPLTRGRLQSVALKSANEKYDISFEKLEKALGCFIGFCEKKTTKKSVFYTIRIILSCK